MKITEWPELTDLVIREFLRVALKPREGIHLSDLDMCIGKSYYRMTAPLPPSPGQLLNWVRGWALQHEILGDDEVVGELDGIKMSMDKGLDGAFLEFKSVMQKTITPETVNKPHWMRRCMGYCNFKGITEFGLFVWPVWGSEFPKAFKVEYTPVEIRINWVDILRRKGDLARALECKSYPILDYHEDWECGYCENNIPGRCFGVKRQVYEKGR